MLTSEQAFDVIKHAGIITNKQTFYRYVREGKINGEIRHKRGGYRFKEEAIQGFIEEYREEKREDPFAELERLRKENSELKHRLKMPDTMIQAENLRLSEKNRELERKLLEKKS